MQRVTLLVGLASRAYHFFLPEHCAPHPVPVVIHYAGYGQILNHSSVAPDLLGWRAVVEERCLAVVLPIGTQDVQDGELTTSWNAAGCSGLGSEWCRSVTAVSSFCARGTCDACGPCSWCACSDDVAFTERILASVLSLPFNVSAFVASGFSNGAMMVYERYWLWVDYPLGAGVVPLERTSGSFPPSSTFTALTIE
ncbi:MAG: hypothetical protein SGPRY_010848 [Prymnesium sp.]